ncbi:hypothetical protein chiPu_0014355 [Chiloscyllium punctatum]|uniref:Uncharacterized protein n=1 Tax=Chiloscyllium punctatum TaxID=137246 RepID=A0A401SZQ1_CHIPU|nr:hypothetical protein [Chiloscyllium punctatum]
MRSDSDNNEPEGLRDRGGSAGAVKEGKVPCHKGPRLTDSSCGPIGGGGGGSSEHSGWGQAVRPVDICDSRLRRPESLKKF